YALYLAYEYDQHPYDSMILNLVSERYPKDEDEDCAFAYGSENCEDQVQEAGSSSAVSIHMQDSSSDSISEAAGEI
ncbi:pentatricopeptide repeat-containing protein, partial [Trifolium medium]|nr:pentatricopeptide repeat-containing protein [Trifolium medium]